MKRDPVRERYERNNRIIGSIISAAVGAALMILIIGNILYYTGTIR